jgi:hypothetical protein
MCVVSTCSFLFVKICVKLTHVCLHVYMYRNGSKSQIKVIPNVNYVVPNLNLLRNIVIILLKG